MVFEGGHGRRGRRVRAGIALSAGCEIIMNGRSGGFCARGDPLFSFKKRRGIFAYASFFDGTAKTDGSYCITKGGAHKPNQDGAEMRDGATSSILIATVHAPSFPPGARIDTCRDQDNVTGPRLMTSMTDYRKYFSFGLYGWVQYRGVVYRIPHSRKERDAAAAALAASPVSVSAKSGS